MEQSIEPPAVEGPADEPASDTNVRVQERTASNELDAKREQIVSAMQRRLGVALVRTRRALYESADSHRRICVTISKRYENEHEPYWYAYHPAWQQFLQRADEGIFVLGCMDREEAFAIPCQLIAEHLPNMNRTVRQGGQQYWHVKLTTTGNEGLALYLSKTGEKIDMAAFRVQL